MTASLSRKEIDKTALARLESEGRLLNPLHKALTGELALRFANRPHER